MKIIALQPIMNQKDYERGCIWIMFLKLKRLIGKDQNLINMFDVIVDNPDYCKYDRIEFKLLPKLEKFMFSMREYYISSSPRYYVRLNILSKIIARYYPDGEQLGVLFEKYKHDFDLDHKLVFKIDMSGKLYHKITEYRNLPSTDHFKYIIIDSRPLIKFVNEKFGYGKNVMNEVYRIIAMYNKIVMRETDSEFVVIN